MRLPFRSPFLPAENVSSRAARRQAADDAAARTGAAIRGRRRKAQSGSDGGQTPSGHRFEIRLVTRAVRPLCASATRHRPSSMGTALEDGLTPPAVVEMETRPERPHQGAFRTDCAVFYEGVELTPGQQGTAAASVRRGGTRPRGERIPVLLQCLYCIFVICTAG